MNDIEILRKRADEAAKHQEQISADLKIARERVRQLQDEWLKASTDAAEARARLLIALGGNNQ